METLPLHTERGGWSFGRLVVWLFSCMSSQMRKLSTKQPNNKTTKPQSKPVFFDLVEEHPSKRKE